MVKNNSNVETIYFDVDTDLTPKMPKFEKIKCYLLEKPSNLKKCYQHDFNFLKALRSSAGMKILWTKETLPSINRLYHEIQSSIKLDVESQPDKIKIDVLARSNFRYLLKDLQKEIDLFVFELRGSIDVFSILIAFAYNLCKKPKKNHGVRSFKS